MVRSFMRAGACPLLCCTLLLSGAALADVAGVAPGIPDPDHRNTIVQLFN
jgi:hypothetical protein